MKLPELPQARVVDLFGTYPPVSFSPWGTDPYLSNVILLMHFDGDYTDKSPLAQAFTNTGTTLSAAGAKFGQSVSINGTSPGGGGFNKVQSNVARLEYDLTSGDMTMEAFVRPDSTSANGAGGRPIVTLGGTSGLTISLYGDNNGTFFRYDFGGVFTLQTSNASVYLINGIWYHVAATKQGNITRLFVNGVLVISSTDATVLSASARVAVIGNFSANSNALDGALDEVRVTKGVARYTASFTPPATPFPDS